MTSLTTAIVCLASTLMIAPDALASDVISLRSSGGEVEFTSNGSPAEAQSLEQALQSSGSSFEAEQGQFCARSKRTDCPIFGSSVFASGFFLNNLNTLITSYHVLHAQIANGYQNLKIDSDPRGALLALQRVPLFLIGTYSGGHQALSTVERPDSVRVQALNPSPYFLMNSDTSELFQQNLFGELSDIVVLNVSTNDDPISRFFKSFTALTVASETFKPGDLLTAYGYPVSADGKASSVPTKITGRAISAQQVVKRLKITESAHNLLLRSTFLIYMEGNCPEGMSGGPILNAHGNVVGVIGGHYQISKTNKYICYGIKMQQLNRLMAQWEYFNNRTLGASHR